MRSARWASYAFGAETVNPVGWKVAPGRSLRASFSWTFGAVPLRTGPEASRPGYRSGRRRGAYARRQRGSAEEEGGRGNPQVLDYVGRPGDEAAAGGEALGEGAHAQVGLALEAEQLAGAGAASAEDAGAVRLVDHQAGAIALAELDDAGQVADVALHREDAVDDYEHAAAIVCGALQHLLQLVHAVVAEGPQLGAGEAAAVEDRGVVAGVDDHGVARLEDRADRAQVRLVAGREDDRVLG